MGKQIEVYGQFILKGDFNVNLPMTEAEFEALSERKQNALIDEQIDWQDATRSATVGEFDVYEYREAQK